MNRLLYIVAVALIAAGGFMWWQNRSQTQPDMSVLELPGAANAQGSGASGDAGPDMSLVQEQTLGDPGAPVTVIEYASFTCPHCEHFHAENWSKLKADYIDTGKVHFIYREVYFDRYGLWAGMLARCGGSTERYFAMTDLLYDHQAEWLASREPVGIADALRKLAKQTGLTDEQFDTCMSDQALAEALVASYQQNATKDGVTGTPSFVVNGRLHPNMDWADLAKVFDEAAK